LAESDLINTDTGDINSTVVSKWNYNLQTIARDAETASVDVKNLQTSTNTCTKGLTTSLALKKFIDEEKRKKLLAGAGGLQKSALGISPYDLAEIPTDTGGFQASKQGDGGDDDVSASNKAGSTGNTDGSGSGSKGDSSPSYASPGGLSSGGGSAGGQGGTASVGSAGSSSLLRGFRNKSYSSRVRVGGQGYSSRGQAGYGKKGSSYNKNSRKKRGKAFNLQAFLPGGKQDPNRRLASISGAGVDIFSVVRRKFKSSCYTKKLLDCK
ncbi:MAG: hypothetical protein HAW63_00005, partial [Bdellovibrionaceae bacterium]|nr:hypothetical protein [Pseudobdellovibrionaceae bacterium]